MGDRAQRPEGAGEEQSLRLLQAILTGIDDHVAMYDRQWRYVFVNDKACEILGKRREELLGLCVWDLYPDAIGNEYYQNVHAAVGDQKIRRFEHYYPPFDRWFESHAYPSLEGVIVYSVDISLRKHFEEQHRDREALLSTVGDNLPGAIYQAALMPDGQRKFSYISAGIENLLGVTPQEIIDDAMALYSLIYEEDVLQVLAAEERAFLTMTPLMLSSASGHAQASCGGCTAARLRENYAMEL